MSELNGGTVGPHEVNSLDDVAQAAVSHGLTQWQKMVQERDSFRQEAERLRAELTSCKIALEAQSSYAAQMESRMADTIALRDQTMAERIKWESLFVGIMAQLKAFDVPAGPLVRGVEHDRENDQDVANRTAGGFRPFSGL
jgi:hypothetical protein